MGLGGQQTPETKDMAIQQRSQGNGEADRSNVAPGTTTPTGFMSGVEGVGAPMSFGKGTNIAVAQTGAVLQDAQ